MDAARWREVSRITADALELEDRDRARYLERACGDDRELRAEVDRILKAHSGFDSMLDGRTIETRSGLAATTEARRGVARAGRDPHDRGHDTRLPAELMERAARRLGIVGMLYAGGFLLAYTVREAVVHVIIGIPYDQPTHTAGQIITGAAVLLGVVVALVARSRTLPAARLVDLGLGFEVAGSLCIALVSYSDVWQKSDVWGVSWLCVWIMTFPLLVPAPPGRMAAAAFASAATGPVAILVWTMVRPSATMSVPSLLATTLPNFLIAALATLGARQIYRTGVELHQAKRLGQYRLVAPLGRGGMGEVWIAEHDLLARPAALKLIRPDLLGHGQDSARIVTRFEQEAQVMATLTSPHTVRLFDFGLTQDGLFYYVMELLDGMDLDSLVRRRGPVPPARAVHILRQACASLAEAHALGIVHRDVKPSNLFVCRQGVEFDFVKVLDMGIVRSIRGGPGAAADVPGPIEGSPAFMAPEAWSDRASPASDLYGLGCVAYWLVTGHAVFEDEGLATIVERHRTETPPLPSSRAGREIPARLEAAIMACLEKEPSRRPQDAAALDALLAAVPGPPWTQEQAGAWWGERESEVPSRQPEAGTAPLPWKSVPDPVAPSGPVLRLPSEETSRKQE